MVFGERERERQRIIHCGAVERNLKLNYRVTNGTGKKKKIKRTKKEKVVTKC